MDFFWVPILSAFCGWLTTWGLAALRHRSRGGALGVSAGQQVSSSLAVLTALCAGLVVIILDSPQSSRGSISVEPFVWPTLALGLVLLIATFLWADRNNERDGLWPWITLLASVSLPSALLVFPSLGFRPGSSLSEAVLFVAVLGTAMVLYQAPMMRGFAGPSALATCASLSATGFWIGGSALLPVSLACAGAVITPSLPGLPAWMRPARPWIFAGILYLLAAVSLIENQVGAFAMSALIPAGFWLGGTLARGGAGSRLSSAIEQVRHHVDRTHARKPPLRIPAFSLLITGIAALLVFVLFDRTLHKHESGILAALVVSVGVLALFQSVLQLAPRLHRNSQRIAAASPVAEIGLLRIVEDAASGAFSADELWQVIQGFLPKFGFKSAKWQMPGICFEWFSQDTSDDGAWLTNVPLAPTSWMEFERDPESHVDPAIQHEFMEQVSVHARRFSLEHIAGLFADDEPAPSDSPA